MGLIKLYQHKQMKDAAIELIAVDRDDDDWYQVIWWNVVGKPFPTGNTEWIEINNTDDWLEVVKSS